MNELRKSLVDEVEATWKVSLGLWWWMFWRTLLVSFIIVIASSVWFTNILRIENTFLLNTLDVLIKLAGVIVSIFFFKQLLNRRFKDFSVSLVQAGAIKTKLTGIWLLQDCFVVNGVEKEYPLGKRAVGTIIYTKDGFVSVNMFNPDCPLFSSDDLKKGCVEEKAKAFDSTMSYSGTYKIEDNKVIHDVQICIFPNWVGKQLVRFFTFEGNVLVLDTAPMVLDGKESLVRLRWVRE